MTYNIIIGNAGNAAIDRVETVELATAPGFLNDSLTGKSNYRSLSSAVAREFFQKHLPNFPDIKPYTALDISIELVNMVSAAREQHEEKIGEKVPGWPSLPMVQILPDGRHHLTTEAEYQKAMERENTDADLARLLWMEWWMVWAMEHCEHPAIYTS